MTNEMKLNEKKMCSRKNNARKKAEQDNFSGIKLRKTFLFLSFKRKVENCSFKAQSHCRGVNEFLHD